MFLLILWGFILITTAIRDTSNQLATIDVTHTKPLIGQYLALEGIEAVYQLPSSSDSIEGVLFVAHGCSHSATDWWPKSTACMKCTGLPVEMNIVREAIYSHKFAVIAVSSMNRVHKCWNSKDIPRVQEIIKYFYSSIIPGKNVSFHALGASSGGSFVGFLSQNKFEIPIASACIQISSIGGDRISIMPPTMFILMSKDSHTINHVKSSMNTIAKTKLLVTSPKEIKQEYFHVHSNSFISLEESRAIHASLVENHFLNSENYLLEDPRTTEWRSTVATAVPTILETKDTLIADQSTISELLNLAWDMHEITDEYLPEVFSWFNENR